MGRNVLRRVEVELTVRITDADPSGPGREMLATVTADALTTGTLTSLRRVAARVIGVAAADAMPHVDVFADQREKVGDHP